MALLKEDPLDLIVVVPDFPKPNVNFRDISTLLRYPQERAAAFDQLARAFATTRIDVVVGIDARGFIVGMALAERLKLPFAMARKPSKLPRKVHRVEYTTEYSQTVLEIQQGDIQQNQRVLLVDDVLATGGTLQAANKLVKVAQATTAGICCLLDVPELNGKESVKDVSTNVVLLQRRAPAKTMPLSDPDKSEFVLLYHPSMFSLAKKLVEHDPRLIASQEVKWGKFPDGYPDILFPGDLAGKRVLYLGSMYDKAEYVEQVSLVSILGRQALLSLDIYFPYFAPATMERVEVPGVLATADTFAQIVSCCMSPTLTGIPTLSVFDIHASTTRFSFSPKDLRMWPLSAVDLVMQKMDEQFGRSKYCIAYPDEGSYKRFRGTVKLNNPQQPYALFAKERIGNERVIKLLEISTGALDFSGFSAVLILDDLIQTGETIFKCHEAIKTRGGVNVCASVTHAVFPERSYLDFMPGGPKAGLRTFGSLIRILNVPTFWMAAHPLKFCLWRLSSLRICRSVILATSAILILQVHV